MVRTLALLSVAGALGTLARYGIAVAMANWKPGFPWATLVINASGCFAFGLVAAMADTRGAISADTRLILTTGFLGAFTTFSTYAFETVTLGRGPQPALALANIALQTILGIALAMAGDGVGKRLGG